MDYTIEERSLKVREPQEYAQTQVSEERRQRVSQAKNSVEVDISLGNVTQMFQK